MIGRGSIISDADFEAESPEIQANAERFFPIVNRFEARTGMIFQITNGFRTWQRHLAIYEEKNRIRKEEGLPALKVPEHSAHLLARAVDIFDPRKELQKWCLANVPFLKESGLYFEAFHTTPNWVHAQDRPASQTFFEPY